MTTRTLTVPPRHGLNVGQVMIVAMPTGGRWLRLWHKVTFRAPPMLYERVTVLHVSPTAILVNIVPHKR